MERKGWKKQHSQKANHNAISWEEENRAKRSTTKEKVIRIHAGVLAVRLRAVFLFA
jgi:hypothetical protein